LGAAMRRETELLFRAVLRQGHSIYELLNADFTFLNDVLAEHYGIPGIVGPSFRRVELADRRRGGLLAHASIHTLTSNPTRTSPVKRGKWILENLLDDAPPPPAPGTDSFPENADITVAANLRIQLAAHRRDASCAVCHNRMDPLGLALENFDPIGRWRDVDHGTQIDASGELPDGTIIDGIVDLRRLLGSDKDFGRCLLKKLFLFGIGRELHSDDEIAIDLLIQELPSEPTLSDLILAIVHLDAFRLRALPR
jgi:hypothetical protein